MVYSPMMRRLMIYRSAMEIWVGNPVHRHVWLVDESLVCKAAPDVADISGKST